jgi:hypothetical protein
MWSYFGVFMMLPKSKPTGRHCPLGHPIVKYPNGKSECATCKRVRERLRYHADLEMARRKNVERVRKLKSGIIEAYGGKCSCCGESHFEFLTIDHVMGGGLKHRRQLTGGGRRAGSILYWWLKKNGYPEGFRVLCMNCNLSFGLYGYCPHQQAAATCGATSGCS